MNLTEGKPLRLLTVFAVPLLVGNLFQQAYNLADSIIVGRFLGADALAAVGATGSISFLFFSLCNGISSGGGIVTAQYFGAGDSNRVQRAIVNSAYLMAVSSVLMSLISFLATPVVLSWMGTPERILPDSITYMRMTCISVPLIGIYNYASSMLRSLGDSRTPLYFLIVSCILNVGMDLLCVRVLSLGVFGAALATMIAQMIAGIGCLLYAFRTNEYFRFDRSHLKPDPEILRHAVRLGLPLALQWAMIAVSTTALQSYVNSFGSYTVAAYTATSRLEQLTQQVFGSLGIALSTYASQNYGAGRLDRVREGVGISVRIVAAVSLVMFFVIQNLGDQLIRFFVSEPEVIALGGRALRITSIFYFFLGMIYVTRSALNGIGDVMLSVINGGVEIGGRLLFPMLFSLFPALGVWSVWWTVGATWTVSALFCFLRYLVWRNKAARPDPSV